MQYLLDGLREALLLMVSGDPVTWSAVWVTIKTSTLAIILSVLIGIPLGFGLGYYQFRGKKLARLLVNTLLALPTVVVGLVVYLLLSNSGPMGELGMLFTVQGVILGQSFLAIPIVVALTASAVEHTDGRLQETLMTLGAGRWQLLVDTLWEVRFAVYAAIITAYGRVVSEVGVSMMVGGNIKWHTRTITTAIALETGKGEFAMGIALGIILMALALLVNGLGSLVKTRSYTS